MPLSRRSVLAATAGLALAPGIARAAGGQKTLRLESRIVEVGGKAASRYGVSQPSGDRGLMLDEGETFDVRLENKLDVLSGLHWHGLNPPWREDGVPYISAPPIAGFIRYAPILAVSFGTVLRGFQPSFQLTSAPPTTVTPPRSAPTARSEPCR